MKVAITGAYGFKSYKTLLKYCNLTIENNFRFKNEFYISNVIKLMIDDSINIENITIEKKYWHCLGTPIQLKYFYNNLPKISCLTNHSKISPKRICFDLDNTLVTFPKVKNDYTTVLPIQKNIDYLKYLKKIGNIIIIYTARRMKTHHGNIGKIMADIGKITFDTLEKFNIPYDEIYFGKPYADFYIDDLAVNCYDNLEKNLGFYQESIHPRFFNSIETDKIDVITKKSDDLSGEIYYYNNIPILLKDLFPIFIKNNGNNEYIIEKIHGVTVSILYVSKLLTSTILINIMNSIKRIQDHKIKLDKINIYDNYESKLDSRYDSYDYSSFPKSKDIYSKIKKNLILYQNNKKGKQTIIHGDPVLSNIIINQYDKIKFIDMRGKMGSNYSIQGDWLYDWSKLYQSIIGYDFILLDKEIDKSYITDMKNIFKNYFIELYSIEDFKNLVNITDSLLFTLIPLHNNKKCIEYYNLITLMNN